VAAWESGRRRDGQGVGYFVIRGFLLRRVAVSQRHGSELIGRGDVVHPYSDLAERAVVSRISWRAERSTLIAVLDDAFYRASATWPQVQIALQERSVPRAHSLLLRLAIRGASSNCQPRRTRPLASGGPLGNGPIQWSRSAPQAIARSACRACVFYTTECFAIHSRTPAIGSSPGQQERLLSPESAPRELSVDVASARSLALEP
jgi:hypothetical protein